MTKIVDSFSFLLNKLCLHQWLTNSQSFVKSVTIHMNCDSSFMDKNASPSFFCVVRRRSSQVSLFLPLRMSTFGQHLWRKM